MLDGNPASLDQSANSPHAGPPCCWESGSIVFELDPAKLDRQDARCRSTSKSDLAERLRRIREQQKINQEEAAERCGLHRTYYSGIERGVRNVSLTNIEKVAKGLRKSLPELFKRV